MTQTAKTIQYEGDHHTLIWKHPCEEFDRQTQLIVRENQEAVFYGNGEILELLGPGRYGHQTGGMPASGRILRFIPGQNAPLHCEIYFISRSEQMSMKWGTDSRVEYVEPVYGFPVSIGASGEMTLRVEDSCLAISKLVGTDRDLSRQRLTEYFRALLMTKIKTYIAQVMKADAISIFEIDGMLMTFSEELRGMLIPDFADYGIALERFFVTNVAKPEGERQYEKFKELHFRQYADIAEAKLRQQTELIDAQTKAQKVMLDARAQAVCRGQEGDTCAKESGQAAAADEVVCPSCGKTVVRGKFCVECGCKFEPACPQCGKKMPEGAKFCMECGARLS